MQQVLRSRRGAESLALKRQEAGLVGAVLGSQCLRKIQAIDDLDRLRQIDMLGPQVAVTFDHMPVPHAPDNLRRQPPRLPVQQAEQMLDRCTRQPVVQVLQRLAVGLDRPQQARPEHRRRQRNRLAPSMKIGDRAAQANHVARRHPGAAQQGFQAAFIGQAQHVQQPVRRFPLRRQLQFALRGTKKRHHTQVNRRR